jgi:transposase-like protein
MKGAIIMPVKQKVATDEKIRIAKLCLSGKLSQREAARQVGVRYMTVHSWVVKYKFQGELGFVEQENNQVYSNELKQAAVNDYLSGIGSQQTIASKYGLRSRTQLQNWIKMYNNGEDFSRKRSGGSRMTTSRKTTKDERIQIVKDCLENGCNYGETAIRHNVSYQQVYGWVKSFKELGEAGLEDRRGKRKVDQEPRSEIEKLQIENERLKHELYMMKMERDLLKKVKELERKDLYRK